MAGTSDRRPLVSVIVPGQQAVTASVSFTGAIAARYDEPIANDALDSGAYGEHGNAGLMDANPTRSDFGIGLEFR